MVAEFKIEAKKGVGLGNQSWENTSVHLEIEIFDLLSHEEQVAPLSITGLQANKAEVIGRALSRQFDAKVRWNWTHDDNGHYIEKEEVRHQDGCNDPKAVLLRTLKCTKTKEPNVKS